MAIETKKISELTELTTPTGEEELVYASGGTNGKIKIKNLVSDGWPTPTYLGYNRASDSSTYNTTIGVGDYEWLIIKAYSSASDGSVYDGYSIFTINKTILDVGVYNYIPGYTGLKYRYNSNDTITLTVSGTNGSLKLYGIC